MDVREEQRLAVELHAVRYADVAHVPTRARGPDRLQHRLLRADALEHRVRADAAGQLLDTGHALVATIGDDVRGAEFTGELLPRLVRLIAMICAAPFCFAASTPSRPTAPSPTTATVVPGLTLAASAANQPVPKTSETDKRLGMRSSGGTSGVDTSVPSESGTRSIGASAPL